MAPTLTRVYARGIFFCNYEGCSATFARLDRLEYHERKHTGERPFMCMLDDCKKSYTRREHLKRHISIFHKSESKDESFVKCDQCSKLFKNKHSLKKHIKRFHEDASLKCETCKKKFLKHRKLKEHTFEHTGIKPFKCTHEGCSKDFVVWANLKRHQKSHEGYACDDKSGCTEVLATWSLLRKHKTEKHSPVPTCDKCGRKFSSRGNLKVHMPSHDDTRKAFHCTYDGCPRYYFFTRNLQHHIRTYHLDKKCPCPFENCGQNFANQTKLKNHLRLHEAKSSPTRHKKNRRKAQKRKERAKALPHKAMACTLSGLEVSKEDEMKLIKGLPLDCELAISEVETDIPTTVGTVNVLPLANTDSSLPANASNIKPSTDKYEKEQVGVSIIQESLEVSEKQTEVDHFSHPLNIPVSQEYSDQQNTTPVSQKGVVLEFVQPSFDLNE